MPKTAFQISFGTLSVLAPSAVSIKYEMIRTAISAPAIVVEITIMACEK